MAVLATFQVPAYLKQARIAAGYANRDTASVRVPYSPETIGRHERGQRTVTPEDALTYATHYNSPAMLIRYCANCPIGKARGHNASDRDLPIAALRLTNRLRQAAREVVEPLEQIAENGTVDTLERSRFDRAIKTLQGLDETIQDLVLYAATNGLIEKKSSSAFTKGTP